MAKTPKSSAPKTPKATKTSKTAAKASKPSKISPVQKKGSKKEEIFRHVCEQYAIGITEVAKSDVALAVGYKNKRSEKFSKGVAELIKVDGLLSKGGKKDTLSLTDKGKESMPHDLEVSNDPTKVHDRYIEFIESKAKSGAEKVRRLWEILMDRKPHPIAAIAKKLGYNNPRSFGNTKIISIMKEMDLVEGTKEVMFTDKVPAFV